MKKTGSLLIGIFISVISVCQTKPAISIIPEPVKVVQNTGYFTLPQNIVIQAAKSTDLKQAVAQLQERLSVPTGYKVSVSDNAANAVIKLELNKAADATLGN